MSETDGDRRWDRHPDAIPLALRELPAYCLRQRWYPAKEAGAPTITLDTLIPVEKPKTAAALAVWKVAVADRDPFDLFIPLAVVTADSNDDSAAIVARLPGGRLLIDALASDAFIETFVGLMWQDLIPHENLQAGHTEGIAALRDLPPAQWRIKRSSVEQSNTSVRIAGSIMKILRRIAPGIHPELEMARFLSDHAHFRATPALMGWVNVGDRTVAILQSFILNEGDGWTWVRAKLKAGNDESERARAWIATLGRRTAEMHAALDAPDADPAFKTEVAGKEDWDRWMGDLSVMGDRVRKALEASQSTLDIDTQHLARQFQESAKPLKELLSALLSGIPSWRKTRHHGDYHLGQILVSGVDAIIVDFEGEPLRPLSDRRAKHVALRDVAGMLRSIQYATATVERELPTALTLEQREQEVQRLRKWADDASRTLMESYLACLADASAQPLDVEAATRIIRFFLIEKALYEVLYELSNRPAWTSIPLQSVVSLTQSEPASADAGAERTRSHRMPFGAQTEAGGVRFRLWAPQLDRVVLLLRAADGSGERTETMNSSKEGWHEFLDPRSRAGTLYEFILPDGMRVPDPASRFQPLDVHGPSEVIEPRDFAWSDSAWQGRAWTEAVVYELHIGTFTAAGTFVAAIERLDHLAALGVTAIELMPVADFPGNRNWGYDGVLWYAPDSSYGRPEDLKTLIQAAHARGIMVLLDVVYNHFGPDGNFLPHYAPGFFTERHKTPWGAAVNYDGPHAHTVREFVIQNALYWIEEFNLDGLRLDAVHAILDDSPTHLLDELARRVRAARSRPVHLVLENEENAAHWLSRDLEGGIPLYSAQWNDDLHHVLHVAATGETQGYYADYAQQTEKLGRALAEGFAFQGERMSFSGRPRGEASSALPPSAFVAFVQNHDQIGNRAFGERLTQIASVEALRAIAAVYLLLPQIPMLFMGEEWGSKQPFPFFCDFDGELAEAVRKGRREEFAKFPEFQDEAKRDRIPDCQAEGTFLSAKLRWQEIDQPEHAAWRRLYRRILQVRRATIVPILSRIRRGGSFEVLGGEAVRVAWTLDTGAQLLLECNLSNAPVIGFAEGLPGLFWAEGRAQRGELAPWSVRWSLSAEGGS